MPGRPRILISTSSFGSAGSEPLELLESAGLDIELNPYGRRLQPPEASALLRDKDGVIAGTELLDREVLRSAPRLRVVSRCGTGVDNVDLATAEELGIVVRTTDTAHVAAVAELTLGGLLAVLRRIPYADARVRASEWEKPYGHLLAGRTIGIVGLGRVGKAFVRLLVPFGVRILAADPVRDESFSREHGVRYLGLDDLLPLATVVSLHVPYEEANRHLLDRRRLALLRPGAVLVNCARGGLVDEQALVELLQDGRLGGAYLDCFEEEPYAGPLRELPNVVLTPHMGTYAAEARLEMEIEAARNLLAGLAG